MTDRYSYRAAHAATLKELAHLRENEPEETGRQLIDDVLNGQGLRRPDFGFIERYLHGELVFHLHGVIQDGGIMVRRTEFCATVQVGVNAGTGVAATCGHGVMPVDARHRGVQASMLVDVRQLQERSHQVVRIWAAPVVRLYLLDDCKGLVGNPVPQRTGELVLRYGSTIGEAIGRFGVQRELSGALPVIREAHTTGIDRIPLDQIEEDVIQGGSKLVEQFADQQGNLGRGLLGDMQVIAALRIGDKFVRLTGCVRGKALLDGLSLFEYPLD